MIWATFMIYFKWKIEVRKQEIQCDPPMLEEKEWKEDEEFVALTSD